jgi:hypothetical protein
MTTTRLVVGLVFALGAIPHAWIAAAELDFNRDVRPILSNNCYFCHGPDPNERKGGIDGLRLDTPEGAKADLGGTRFAVVPGKPEESELVARVTSTDPDLQMPPAATGKKLSLREIEVLKQWVAEGAKFAPHWSYAAPVRPEVPKPQRQDWARNDIDRFILARLEKEGLSPSVEADRPTLIRRVALDLTGLPPTVEEVDAFVADQDPKAYENMVDRMLAKPAFGEHWARMWLDLARYADSAGYADDPPRTIWAYRDYVIRAFNENRRFDRFTIEQIAGDLLPNPTFDDLVATAFHRNTLTNSEGGTNDEEFRTVAIVDRVNTTMAVWMGTSMACAQCHTHKFDPISQEEYFRFYAILNNTQDDDRRDEAPLLEFFSDDQNSARDKLTSEIALLEQRLQILTPEMEPGYNAWRERLSAELPWKTPAVAAATSQSGTELATQPDGSILAKAGSKADVYTIDLPLEGESLSGIRLETLPDDSLPNKGTGFGGGNFVVTRIKASVVPVEANKVTGRFVRIENGDEIKILSLAEVQVFSGADNVALGGEAKQISTAYDGEAKRAIDGNTNGNYYEANSVTHTGEDQDKPWWEVDLKEPKAIDRLMIWNRTDGNVGGRLKNYRVTILDADRNVVFEKTVAESPAPSAEISASGVRDVSFQFAGADYAQADFEAASLLKPEKPAKEGDLVKKGWAIGGQADKPHALQLASEAAVKIPPGAKLQVVIEQHSVHENHTLGRFRLSYTADDRLSTVAQTPVNIVQLARTKENPPDQARELALYYTKSVSPELSDVRSRRGAAKGEFDAIKPNTVPIYREMEEARRRKTRLQFRGNFEDLGQEVTEGTPVVFHALSGSKPDRMALAQWLIDRKNPLTARVLANRFWEQVFGIGIVRTSEEFGSQGELPSHPELLDWLAVEFMDGGVVEGHWNMKGLLKTMVTSAAYRQTSKVSTELFERDQENRLLARGPRTRLSAEMVRDQALAIAGLLSPKMYGVSVRPPRPSLGLNAAFGGGLDWNASTGEDRYRRGLYTEWRRTSPYPSMATFDAPNREVCTLRRPRTNTPLQALVTLNDPVYVEAAQALARMMITTSADPHERITLGFKRTLGRPPSELEMKRMLALVEESKAGFADDASAAMKLATDPLGPLPEGADAGEYAAWTVLSNVLLNLDEALMKR